MQLDRILSKIFSRVGIVCLVLLMVFGLFCMGACNEADIFLCLFCGCVTPETCFEACDCACELTCDTVEGCMSGCHAACLDLICFDECVIATSDCVSNACEGCFSGCFVDENGEPIVCENACTIACDECFECAGEDGGSSDGGYDYATDEEFYEWLEKNGY